jgi:uncharacterized protein (TIGR02001 family)
MKKIATILVALAGFAGLSISASAQQPSSSYSITTDFSYTSQYVFRGLQRVKGDAFTPSLEGAVDNFYLGIWTMQPVTRYEGEGQNNEIDIYAGYKQKLTRALSVEVAGTYYWYPEAVTVDGFMQTKRSYEFGARLTYANRGITASASGYYDFRLQALTGVGLIGYSFPIAKLGTSIDMDFYLGAVDGRDWTPDAVGVKTRGSYNYYGFDINVPYHVTENATISAGLHYATNQNTSDALSIGNKIWFTLGATMRF